MCKAVSNAFEEVIFQSVLEIKDEPFAFVVEIINKVQHMH